MCRLSEEAPLRDRFTVRISRTELDPVRIVHRLLSTFELPGVDGAVLQRWSVLRQKPVAVANHVVWQALIGTYDRDEEILPLSYRLRPIVEANLRMGFAAMADPEAATRPLQLLAPEQMEQVLSDTVLPFQPSYEQVRSRLQESFDELILGGVRLVPAMREISRRVRAEYGVRPILIIDDLVQSMNVYASDLLDYLITLEEGEWDVVVGLTPASFEWDRRGRELLLRVRELDTVDDRVTKLDLSDTTGDQSAFLDENSVVDLLLPYLDRYKQAAGYMCGRQCPHWERCGSLQWGTNGDTQLGPFNRAFLTRIWNNIPAGKGRVRHLLLAVREGLERMVFRGEESLEELPDLIQRDRFVSHSDSRVRALLECYAPSEPHALTVPEDLGVIWQLNVPQTVTVHPLMADAPSAPSHQSLVVDEPAPDPTLAAVRDWLEGTSPNPELLKPLRLGTARLIRDLVDPALLAGVGHAQCTGILRWSAVQHGASLPIRIEGVDHTDGLPLPRGIGGICFDLVAYGVSRGRAKAAFLQRLVVHPQVSSLLYRAEEQRLAWQENLERHLGCSIRELAFHLYHVMISLGGSAGYTLAALQPQMAPDLVAVAWPEDVRKLVGDLFQDCFLLREHLWDGPALADYLEQYPCAEASLTRLSVVATQHVSEEYRMGGESLNGFLNRYRAHLDYVLDYVEGQCSSWTERKFVAETCAMLSDGRRRNALQKRLGVLQALAGNLALVPLLPSLPPQGVLSEVKLALQPLLDLEPPGPGIARSIEWYRILTLWSWAESNLWVNSVIQWRRDLNRLLDRLLAEQSSGQKLEEAPLPTLLLFDRIRVALGVLRSTMVESEGSSFHGYQATYTRIRRLVSLLVPSGFAVTKWCKVSLQTEPTAANHELALLIRTALRASAWWEAFIQQLPLVHRRRRRPQLHRVLEFIRTAQKLQDPDTELVRTWERFVAGMRRSGMLDLPLTHLGEVRDLSPQLRVWLSEVSEGVRLSDVDPEVLVELVRCAPNLARLFRITMVQEVADHGVLHLLDG